MSLRQRRGRVNRCGMVVRSSIAGEYLCQRPARTSGMCASHEKASLRKAESVMHSYARKFWNSPTLRKVRSDKGKAFQGRKKSGGILPSNFSEA